jgi:hypothetical protein
MTWKRNVKPDQVALSKCSFLQTLYLSVGGRDAVRKIRDGTKVNVGVKRELSARRNLSVGHLELTRIITDFILNTTASVKLREDVVLQITFSLNWMESVI